MSYYRIQIAERDTADLLNPEFQTSLSYCDDEDVRNGISVCDSLEDLVGYLAQVGIPFDASYVVVELDGYQADDEDADANLGARLVIPTEIVSVTSITDQLLDLIDAAYEIAA